MKNIFPKPLLSVARCCAAIVLLACGVAGADPNNSLSQTVAQTPSSQASAGAKTAAVNKAALSAPAQDSGYEDLCLFAYPVPFRPNSGDAQRYGTWTQGIRFSCLPSSGMIRIYTLSGALVRSLDVETAPRVTSVIGIPISDIVWDVKNSAVAVVASGVYIWEITSGPNRKTGKLAVIK